MPERLPEFLRDWGWPVQSPLESRWTEVAGVKIHSRSSKRGTGTPFVMVPGLVISTLYFIPLAERLAESAEVHAVDLPGFGRSGRCFPALSIPAHADLLREWMRAMGIDRCHLIANSMGSQIAADLASRFPDTAATVTLIGPTIDPAAHSIPRQALRLITELIREPLRLLLDLTVDFIRAGLFQVISQIGKMFADHIEEKLPRVVSPALVICGEHDAIAPERWAQQAVELLPDARRLAIAGGYHCVHFTHPDQVARILLSFTEAVTDAPAS